MDFISTKYSFKKKLVLCLLIIPILFLILNSCGIGKKLKDLHEPVDLRTSPLDPDERAKRNIEEGRGISLGNLGNRSTTYEFSTSNPMWRASLETLDFIPMATVDYSGGMIITDWYSENSNVEDDSIKITVRFLSNEIRSDSLKIIVHKKTCKNSNCKITLLPNESKIRNELLQVILRKASLFEKEKKAKKQ